MNGKATIVVASLQMVTPSEAEHMDVNGIVRVKTLEVETDDGPAVAMMIALAIGDAAAADEFVMVVAERFKLERMSAPPNTSMLLLTIIGEMSAESFAARWKQVVEADPVIGAFMAKMVVAEVVQGTNEGQQLSLASLL